MLINVTLNSCLPLSRQSFCRFYIIVLSISLLLLSCESRTQGKKLLPVQNNVLAVTADVPKLALKSISALNKTNPDSITLNETKDSTATNFKPLNKSKNNKLPAAAALKSAVVGPDTVPGSILPARRIVAFYGNPLSKRMGILGELPASEMLAKLDEEVAAWQKADPKTPVQPALHLIAVTAQDNPSNDGKYRLRMATHVIDTVLIWAKKRNALVFLDIQVGQSTLQEELPLLESYFKLPNVHVGIDAEFSMKGNGVPGKRIGTYDAADINYASRFLATIARQNQLPPKLLIVHRYTQPMITNYKNIKLNPYCQIVMHMDGWGRPSLKRGTYTKYIKGEPVQYAGFKVFYKNDIKQKGGRLMKPKEILALTPKPYYIQYQ